MKTKNFDKKLVLSKETVADLNVEEMQVVYGGATAVSVCQCPIGTTTFKSRCCP
jgi:natural product precursor